MATKQKMMSPRDAKTHEQLCGLRRDNYETPDFWILADIEQVTIAKQKDGEGAEWMHSIPRKDFNKLIDWYLREQKV